jgi:hypothetical protein
MESGAAKEIAMITVEYVESIGTTRGTDPGQKTNPETARLQAIINLTDAVKAVAIVLIEIRDANNSPAAVKRQ